MANVYVEIIPQRLYWTTLDILPQDTEGEHYFSIDKELVYTPLCSDFGPLNLAMVARFCQMLRSKLQDPSLANKRIVHCCSADPAKRANAAVLMGAYQVVVLRRTAKYACELFHAKKVVLVPFRDASGGESFFHLSMEDCMYALEKAMKCGWFSLDSFNISIYEYFGMYQNGDLNWVIPDKFLAFSGPSSTRGSPGCTPEDYVGLFNEANVGLVVRLNQKQYDENRFTRHGIRHSDMYFPDGSCPPPALVNRFLEAAESESGAIAVHCKAGLGRTCTLISLYAMKHHGWTAREIIAWCRMCRPGSILGQQQQYLMNMQQEMFAAASAKKEKIPSPPPSPMRPMRLSLDANGKLLAHEDEEEQVDDADVQFASLFESLSAMHLRTPMPPAMPPMSKEDVGQGERLCMAKLQAATCAQEVAGFYNYPQDNIQPWYLQMPQDFPIYAGPDLYSAAAFDV
eukprot:TRINITY_DN75177_c0_g1_i1.p1 TRINITY_DN75177_c0_g1~~TRINITY_DN75177_c0_g1_i1.p1  ORF type:complete len:456 (+),score=89.67 TRINITY_DN75177_c0_g1_i1:100-1467(+)